MKDYRQAVTAGINGVISTGVDVGSLLVLIKVGHLPVAAATFLAASAGAVINFTLNKYLAFKDHSRITWAQLTRFGGVALGTACLLAVLMQIFAVWMGVPILLAKVVSAALVFVGWTYPVQRKLVFKPSSMLPAASMS